MKTRRNEGISHDVSMIFPHFHREKEYGENSIENPSKLEGKLKIIQLESHDFWVVFWDETIFGIQILSNQLGINKIGSNWGLGIRLGTINTNEISNKIGD